LGFCAEYLSQKWREAATPGTARMAAEGAEREKRKRRRRKRGPPARMWDLDIDKQWKLGNKMTR